MSANDMNDDNIFSGSDAEIPDTLGLPETGIQKVPVMPLSEVVIFPYALSPLVVEGETSIKLVETAMNGSRLLGLFPELSEQQIAEAEASNLKIQTEKFDSKTLAETGVLGRIVKMLKFPDGTVRVLIRGLARIKLVSQVPDAEPPCAIVERVHEEKDEAIETLALARNAIKQFHEVISYSPAFPEELKIAVLNMNDNIRIVDLIADTINISFLEKLSVLSLPKLQDRLQLLTILLNREMEVLKLGSEIQLQVHNALGKSQREFFLREQLKKIKEELGEENRNPDLIAIDEKIKKLNLPESVLEVLKKEMERLEMIPQASAEYNVAYNYIDWLISVPWNNFTTDSLDVTKSSEILDADHYGLKDVKERILEFIAVLQLKKDRKAPILCFIGPPGVGKTSLGQSIAKSLNRKFVRMSLGGVRDEAEIRGHRRTYVGALPGRIIQGMKKAGSTNPVFMLDEIDKLGNDFRGDPASALLEVLDPQQNNTFNDHYLEIDYDLSSVMFIATANIMDTIPGPLLDRMEIIRLPGYTAMEKKQIASRFLVPRQIKENGLKTKQLAFNASAIDEMINHYTREAGVRTLERTIGSVCRKIARKSIEGKIDLSKKKFTVDSKEVQNCLGPRKFLMDESPAHNESGTATGLAWTSVGGSILPIEATTMPGKGELKLTGSLGDVMKESAQTAFSFVKSHADEFKINFEDFQKKDFHIHVPDGATPKDGPSAGVTLAVTIVSLLTGRKVKAHHAMTGEITLKGRVTAVGGIKEKVIAALRSGIKTVVMPLENEKDLQEIPDEVKKKLNFKFVNKATEAIKFLLEK